MKRKYVRTETAVFANGGARPLFYIQSRVTFYRRKIRPASTDGVHQAESYYSCRPANCTCEVARVSNTANYAYISYMCFRFYSL